MSHTQLFTEFAAAKKADWQKEVLKELKETPFESLIGRNFDDFEIEPLYTQTDLQNLSYLQHYQPISEVSEATYAPRIWRNAPIVWVRKEKESNQKALLALQNGADEIVFDISEKNAIDWQVLLKDIGLEYCAISIMAQESQFAEIKNYLDFANDKPLTGSISFQTPLSDEKLLELFKLTTSFPKLKIAACAGEFVSFAM